jgi:F0F1-type ATP synthase assembly protein I
MARQNETSPTKDTKRRWRRKKSDGTKQPGRLQQMVEVFKYTAKTDRSTAPLMLLGLLGSVAIGVLLTVLIFDSPWYGVFLGLAVGVLVAMLILARKAERAAFARIKGEPGAALAAMQSIRRGWNVSEEPAQVDPRSQKMVFRAAGRAGIAIVAEDSTSLSMKLVDKERKAVRRVLGQETVPVHTVVVGDGEDEVALHKLPSHLTRMKKVLTKDESAQVNKRLHALEVQRSIRQSIPKGIDPNRARPNRKAMRGR